MVLCFSGRFRDAILFFCTFMRLMSCLDPRAPVTHEWGLDQHNPYSVGPIPLFTSCAFQRSVTTQGLWTLYDPVRSQFLHFQSMILWKFMFNNFTIKKRTYARLRCLFNAFLHGWWFWFLTPSMDKVELTGENICKNCSRNQTNVVSCIFIVYSHFLIFPCFQTESFRSILNI